MCSATNANNPINFKDNWFLDVDDYLDLLNTVHYMIKYCSAGRAILLTTFVLRLFVFFSRTDEKKVVRIHVICAIQCCSMFIRNQNLKKCTSHSLSAVLCFMDVEHTQRAHRNIKTKHEIIKARLVDQNC